MFGTLYVCLNTTMINALILVVFSFLSLNSKSIDSDKLVLAFQNGNATEISNFFSSSIELKTPNTSGVSTKEQAKMILENFFKTNKPTKATLTHESVGVSNLVLIITVNTSNGEFRATITGVSKSGSFQITELKIS